MAQISQKEATDEQLAEREEAEKTEALRRMASIGRYYQNNVELAARFMII